MKKFTTAALAASLISVGGVASAATTTSVVDFTSQAIPAETSVLNYNGVALDGDLNVIGLDGTIWTVEAQGGFFNSDLPDTNAQPCGLLACVVDGLGINDDEVESGPSNPPSQFDELISITASSTVDIFAVWVLDLFEPEVAIFFEEGGDLEPLLVPTNDGVVGDNPNGLAITGVEPAFRLFKGETIYFSAMLDMNDDFDTDAALAGIQYTVVPLPAAGWMLLAGLGGLAAMRRRKS